MEKASNNIHSCPCQDTGTCNKKEEACKLTIDRCVLWPAQVVQCCWGTLGEWTASSGMFQRNWRGHSHLPAVLGGKERQRAMRKRDDMLRLPPPRCSWCPGPLLRAKHTVKVGRDPGDAPYTVKPEETSPAICWVQPA